MIFDYLIYLKKAWQPKDLKVISLITFYEFIQLIKIYTLNLKNDF